jgi:hypothetical protein
MTTPPEHSKLSTSALAKTLNIPQQQLFVTLRDCGWIRKVEDGWLLTAKGEFEGGEYVHSKRYGRYIVWPDTLVEHPLLRGIESNRLVNTTHFARKYQIATRQVRRVLGELGLLQRTFNGWELTRSGEQLGGILIDSDNGDSEIHWPEAFLENPLVVAAFEYVQRLDEQSDEPEGDLLSAITELASIDGHSFHNRGEWLICHWLYFAGINHACHRRLPLIQTTMHEQRADFWLPEAQLYIEYAGDEHDAAEIAATMERIEIYKKNQWRYIEVLAEHLAHLDDFLTRKLHEFGVRVF